MVAHEVVVELLFRDGLDNAGRVVVIAAAAAGGSSASTDAAVAGAGVDDAAIA